MNTYHPWRLFPFLERSAVDDLASFEFGMTDFYSCEQLHLPNDTWDGLQTIKEQVDLSLIQLIMLSCGRLKLEAHKPVNIKVHQEMNDLRTQLVHNGMVYADLGLGRGTAWFPFQYIHLHSAASSPTLTALPLHKMKRELCWLLGPGPDVAVQVVCQAASCLLFSTALVASGGQ